MASDTANKTQPVTQPKVGPGEPGFALGLAGFITSFVWGIVGIILSAIGLSQSKKIGKGNTFAFVGLIIGIVQTVLSVLAIAGLIFAFAWFGKYCNDHPDSCNNSNSSGSYYYPQDGAQPDRTW